MSAENKLKSKIDMVMDLKKEHIPEAIEVNSRAFQNYSTTVHMMPDEDERRKKLKYGFVPMFKFGMAKGVVHATSPNLEGLSVWFPPDEVHQSVFSMMRYGGFKAFRKSGYKAMKRGLPLFKYMVPAHKRNAPFDHWYLQNLAVDPAHQGKGFGSILMIKMLELIDEQGLPAYLETNEEKNLQFYQKHGFEVVEYTIVPNTEVPFWCMLRKAQ